MKIVNVTVEVEEEEIDDGWDWEHYAVLRFNEHTAMKIKMKYGFNEEDAVEQLASKLWELTSENED